MKIIKNRKKAIIFALLTLFTIAQPLQAGGIGDFFKNLFKPTPKPVTTLDLKKAGNYAMYAFAATVSLWTCNKLYSYLFSKKEEHTITSNWTITLQNTTFKLKETKKVSHIGLGEQTFVDYSDVTLEKAQNLFELEQYNKQTIENRHKTLQEQFLPTDANIFFADVESFYPEILNRTKELLLAEYNKK